MKDVSIYYICTNYTTQHSEWTCTQYRSGPLSMHCSTLLCHKKLLQMPSHPTQRRWTAEWTHPGTLLGNRELERSVVNHRQNNLFHFLAVLHYFLKFRPLEGTTHPVVLLTSKVWWSMHITTHRYCVLTIHCNLHCITVKVHGYTRHCCTASYTRLEHLITVLRFYKWIWL